MIGVELPGLEPSGYLKKEGTGWSAIHDAAEADSCPVGSSYIGLRRSSDWYSIKRSYLYFNTAFLTGKTILAAWLKIYGGGYLYSVGGNPYIVAQNGQPLYPSDALALGDYNYSLYSGNGGQTPCPLSGSDWVFLTFNSTGRSWINKGGQTKLCLRLSTDIDSTPPASGGNEFTFFPVYAYLCIQYEDEEEPPTPAPVGYAGYVWVEDADGYLHYIDASGYNRYSAGAYIETVGILQAGGLRIIGTKLCYVNQNGERYGIEGTLVVGSIGTASDIKVIDTTLAYIDEYGQERRIEGDT
jgi:hypothetical protein